MPPTAAGYIEAVKVQAAPAHPLATQHGILECPILISPSWDSNRFLFYQHCGKEGEEKPTHTNKIRLQNRKNPYYPCIRSSPQSPGSAPKFRVYKQSLHSVWLLASESHLPCTASPSYCRLASSSCLYSVEQGTGSLITAQAIPAVGSNCPLKRQHIPSQRPRLNKSVPTSAPP